MDDQLAARVKDLYDSAWRDAARWDPDLNAAVALLTAHLDEEPACIEALTSLGAILSDLGRHRDAVSVLRLAKKLKSTDANTHYNLGTALANLDASGRRSAPAHFFKAESLSRSPRTIRAYFDPHAH